jgi:uncharacterized membrane protein YiaA
MFNFPQLDTPMGIVFMIAMVWSLIWKGLALWKSARLEQKGWFVALLILNTVGILDILYLYVFSKKKENVVAS